MSEYINSRSHRLGNLPDGPDYFPTPTLAVTRVRPEISALEYADGIAANADLQVPENIVCPQTDPEVFFPEQGMSGAAAKKICQSCVAIEPCLEYALKKGISEGVWGGTSGAERRRILMARKRATSK